MKRQKKQELWEKKKEIIKQQKKDKKKNQDAIDLKEHKQLKHQEKLDIKKSRLHDLHRQFAERLSQIEKKRHEKESVITNIKSAFGEFNSQKKEINLIKKQDQEMNLIRHRRIQSAYKHLLVEKLAEKDERQRSIAGQRDQMISYQRDNGFDFKQFVRMSNQIHSKSFITLKKDNKNN